MVGAPAHRGEAKRRTRAVTRTSRGAGRRHSASVHSSPIPGRQPCVPAREERANGRAYSRQREIVPVIPRYGWFRGSRHEHEDSDEAVGGTDTGTFRTTTPSVPRRSPSEPVSRPASIGCGPGPRVYDTSDQVTTVGHPQYWSSVDDHERGPAETCGLEASATPWSGVGQSTTRSASTRRERRTHTRHGANHQLSVRPPEHESTRQNRDGTGAKRRADNRL